MPASLHHQKACIPEVMEAIDLTIKMKLHRMPALSPNFLRITDLMYLPLLHLCLLPGLVSDPSIGRI